MNKKLIGLLVPVLGGIAIVGSGFSAWHFSDGELAKTKDIKGNVTVTPLATIGELKAGTETLTVTLDQKAKVGAGNYLTEGIIIEEQDKFNFTFTENKQFAEDNSANQWGYTKFVASVAFASTDNIASYVDVSIVNGDSKVSSLDIPMTGTTPVEKTYNLALTWKNNKPTSVTEYNAMLNTLKPEGTDKITFTITVSVALA